MRPFTLQQIIYVWMDRWIDGWMHGSIDGSIDGWMDACVHVCMYVYKYIYIFFTYQGKPETSWAELALKWHLLCSVRGFFLHDFNVSECEAARQTQQNVQIS